MLPLQKIRQEFEFNNTLAELLDVLKGVAASQFAAVERKKERFAAFLDAFEGFFQMIDFSSVQHPFAVSGGRLALIVLSSDEGFMGGLNSRVITAALAHPGAEDAMFIAVGERGAAFLRELGRECIVFPGITEVNRFEMAADLKNYIIREGMKGTFGRLVLAYPKPVSFAVQTIDMLTILPCSELFFRKDSRSPQFHELILESSVAGIIEYLLETWITEKLLEVFEDSILSEFSARTVHLEESHQVLLSQGKMLQFQYFRSRHALVDKGIRETFAALSVRRKKPIR